MKYWLALLFAVLTGQAAFAQSPTVGLSCAKEGSTASMPNEGKLYCHEGVWRRLQDFLVAEADRIQEAQHFAETLVRVALPKKTVTTIMVTHNVGETYRCNVEVKSPKAFGAAYDADPALACYRVVEWLKKEVFSAEGKDENLKIAPGSWKSGKPAQSPCMKDGKTTNKDGTLVICRKVDGKDVPIN